MPYSGVSWSANGYEVEVLDDNGRRLASPMRFGGGHLDELVGYLRGLGPDLVTVVESTNGVIDGQMMISELDVYRADPWMLPERPLLGSVSARTLARLAWRDLSALTKLEIRRGSQTGREHEIEAGVVATAAEVDALTATGRCLSHGNRGRPEIALTFDDGPGPPYTGQILDILERYGVPATFFCIGLNAGGHAEHLTRMRVQGHAIGNHTWSHPFLPDLSRAQLVEQVSRAGDTIAEAGGGGAPTLFRPPYGSRTPAVLDWLTGIDPTIVLWDVAPEDWMMPGADVIARVVLDQVRPGSVVLLHDGGGDRSQTVAALAVIIEGLLRRGFRFVSVDDLVTATVVETTG